MGEQQVQTDLNGERLREFMQRILTDLRALEHMLESGKFETGVRRIGAEQELALIDRHGEPAMLGPEVLERISATDATAGPYFTTELGRFNIEYNTDPIEFGSDCLGRLEKQLTELLAKARTAAQELDADILLTGILPTLRKTHLDLQYMTPMPRYYALNDALTRLRGGEYEFRLTGVDELIVKHDSVMVEACNTSFQVHFQVDPEEFARRYNFAQAVTGPVLAACANSPLLFGKRLWRETRIGLFQQAVDTRSTGSHAQERKGRVSFGDGWIKSDVLEIFREEVSRYRLLFGTELGEDPFAALEAGRIPQLDALRLHNGTIYRWNRPCYGITGGKPHLRIENRVLPAGPSIVDSVANAAFWFGLMSGMAAEYEDITKVMDFDVVKGNFLAAARAGLQAQLNWDLDKPVPAQDLIGQQLLPLARRGLEASNIDAADIDKYLGIIEERVSSGQTGAAWQLQSLAAMKDQGTSSECIRSMTSAMLANQKGGAPVHTWPVARIDRGDTVRRNFQQVEQYMRTDVITANHDDPVELVANMMDWQKVRHIPIEDNQHRLVGLVTYRQLIRVYGGEAGGKRELVPVSDVMKRDLITVTPETHTVEAIKLMKTHQVSCLPVVKDERLVGLITERDFLTIASELIERELNR